MSQRTGLNPDYVAVKSWVKAAGYYQGSQENDMRSKGAPLPVDFGMGKQNFDALCRRHAFMSSQEMSQARLNLASPALRTTRSTQ